MRIRLATPDDLPDIMRIEEETFGRIGEDTMAPWRMMKDRIARCNVSKPGWFWVVVEEKKMLGYVVFQPTRLHPNECTSWSMATDNGTLESTYDEEGETIFTVSLGVIREAPPITTQIFFYQALWLWMKTGKKRVMFCSRIPGYAEAYRKTGISPEDYCNARTHRGVPKDSLLRKFYLSFGVGPYKLLPNGWPDDPESMGHGALVVFEDTVFPSERIPARIRHAGLAVERLHEGE